MTAVYLAPAVAALAGLVVAPFLLRDATALDARPRLGLAVWFALGALGWFGLFGLALRLGLGGGRSLPGAVLTFVDRLGDGHPLRGLGLREVFGLSVAFDIVVLLIGGWIAAAWVVWRERQAQRAVLDLVAEVDPDDPVLRLLPHDLPVAYFLPGSGGRVVISRGTRRALSDDELAAVLAHERGHGRGHHGTLLVPMQALSSFVSFLPYARYAPSAVSTYVEMAADDQARASTSTLALRRALEKAPVLARAPLGTIGLTASAIERRLRRLDHDPTNGAHVLSGALVAAVTLLTLWVLVVGH